MSSACVVCGGVDGADACASITASAYLPQPQGKTALISGLNYISRIFAVRPSDPAHAAR